MIDSDLFVNMILGIMDVIMFYYLYCGLIDIDRHFSIKKTVIGIIGGCIMGSSVNFIGQDISSAIFYLIIIGVIHLSYKRKIYNAIFIFVFIYFILAIIQLTVGLILFPFPIEIKAIKYLTLQTLSLLVIVYICTKVAIHRLLYVTEKNSILKLIFLTLSCTIYGLLFYSTFKVAEPYYVFYLLIVVISVFFLCNMIKRAYFQNSAYPIIGEGENALFGISVLLNYTKDFDLLKENVDECNKVLGSDTDTLKVDSNAGANILYTFIHGRDYTKSKWKKLYFDIDIEYIKPHSKIPITVIMMLFGTLLDNAIETCGSGKKIKISIVVNEELIYILVANPYSEGLLDEFIDVFNQDFPNSQQYIEGQPYGLFKLSEIISGYDGKFIVKEDYIIEEQENYIFMTIEI